MIEKKEMFVVRHNGREEVTRDEGAAKEVERIFQIEQLIADELGLQLPVAQQVHALLFKNPARMGQVTSLINKIKEQIYDIRT